MQRSYMPKFKQLLNRNLEAAEGQSGILNKGHHEASGAGGPFCPPWLENEKIF